MQYILIIIIIISILALLLLGISIYGAVIYRPSTASEVYINPQIGKKGKVCLAEPVRCARTSDCKNVCLDFDTVEMKCVEMKRTGKDQEKIFGKGGKFCLPVKPEKPCNKEHGGVDIWTGWAGIEQMEWDCACTWPNYYGSDSGCVKRNPGICHPGTFTFDIKDSKGKPPSADNCKCHHGYQKIIRGTDGSPICAPINLFPNFYNAAYSSKISS